MIAYWAILRARTASLFQYRIAAFAGIATQVFWGIVRVMILTAFYMGSDVAQPITLAQAVNFLWIAQALLQPLPWSIDKDIEAQIRTGQVAIELVRPLDIYWHWFMRALAMRLVPTALRIVPMVIVAVLFFQLSLPVSFEAGVAFALSSFCAVLLAASITTLIIISLFWTIAGEGIERLMPHIAAVLSGLIVPLQLFPDWMQGFLNLQPYRGIIDIPSRIYMGIIPLEEVGYYLAFQLIWTFLLILLGRLLVNKAIRQYVVAGG